MSGETKLKIVRSKKRIEAPIVRPILPKTKHKNWWVRLYRMATRKIMYEVMEEYRLYLPFLDITLLIPKGFKFDGASIPKFLWPILAPIDVLLITAVFHDFAYRYRTYITDSGCLYLMDCDRKVYDEMFKDISYYTNGLGVTSYSSYLMLRIFGFFAWKENRKDRRRVKRDFPEVLVDTTCKIYVR